MKLYRMFLVTVILLLCIPKFCFIECGAETDIYNEIYKAGNAQKIEQNIPDEAEKFLDGIDIKNPESLSELTPEKIFRKIMKEIREKSEAPLKMLVSVIAVILLSVMTEGIADGEKSKGIRKIFEILCVLVCITIIAEPLSECFLTVSRSINSVAEFMMTFTPVFTGIIIVSGGITSAGCYQLLIFAVSQIAIQVSDSVFMQIIGMCMALAVVDAINPCISLGGLINGLKKAVTWGLGLTMTIFTGLLSIQSIVGSSVDGLTSKTAKFLISGFIPVIGGAVSEAYATVKGSLAVLRGSTGAIGIAVIFAIILPSVIRVVLYMLTLNIAEILSEIFGVNSLNKLFKSMGAVAGMAFATVMCFSLMLIVSTAIVIMTSTGV